MDPKDKKDQDEEMDMTPNEGVDEEELEGVKEEDASQEATKSHDESDGEEEVNQEITDNEESEDEPPTKEHTLEDLAEEEALPTGVNPSKPKSFTMDDEEVNSSIPTSGIYSNERNTSSFSRQRGGNGGKSRLLLLGLIALLVIGGAVYLLKGNRFGQSSSPSPSEQPQASVEVIPSPSPSPTLDRSKYKVRVLNGTSTTGLAASVSAKLKDLGYQIDKTGNATNSAFTQTQVRAKIADITLGLIDQLIKDLSPDYSGASSSADLKTSDNADAEVIIGTK